MERPHNPDPDELPDWYEQGFASEHEAEDAWQIAMESAAEDAAAAEAEQ